MIDEKTFDAVEDRRLAAALNDSAFLKPIPSSLAAKVGAMANARHRRPPRWLKVAAALVAVASFVSFAAVVGGRIALDAPADSEDGDERPVQEGSQATESTEATVSAITDDALVVPSVTTAASVPSASSTTLTKGETLMSKAKAAAAALSAAFVAAPLAAANGDEYQFIISGEIVAVTEGCSSDSSSTTLLTSGTLADGVVYDSELEARYRTSDESNTSSLSSDKIGMVILFK